jgi:hypothetical protein
LITGTVFALVHLDYTPILWPYYVAVAALYSTVTSLTWLHGKPEWQSSRTPSHIRDPGVSIMLAVLVATLLAMCVAFLRLSKLVRLRASKQGVSANCERIVGHGS